jgi:hypothetical protein
MELSYLLYAGSLAGLISILGHAVAMSLLDLVGRGNATIRALQVQVAEAFLHMGYGIVLGFVFWLSWGLTAIVQVDWWVRGMTFGGLATLACAPVMLNVLLSTRTPTHVLAIIAARWLTSSFAVGLSCAWMWDRGP